MKAGKCTRERAHSNGVTTKVPVFYRFMMKGNTRYNLSSDGQTSPSWRHQTITIAGPKRYLTKETAWRLHEISSYINRSQHTTLEISCCPEPVITCLYQTPWNFIGVLNLQRKRCTPKCTHPLIFDRIAKRFMYNLACTNITNFPTMKSARCNSSSIQNYCLWGLAKISCCNVGVLYTQEVQRDIENANASTYWRRKPSRCAMTICTEA